MNLNLLQKLMMKKYKEKKNRIDKIQQSYLFKKNGYYLVLIIKNTIIEYILNYYKFIFIQLIYENSSLDN